MAQSVSLLEEALQELILLSVTPLALLQDSLLSLPFLLSSCEVMTSKFRSEVKNVSSICCHVSQGFRMFLQNSMALAVPGLLKVRLLGYMTLTLH